MAVYAAAHPPAPFIVGVGRSGTTLLRLMLDAHSCLAIPAETGFLADAAGLVNTGDAAREPLFALLTEHKSWADFGIDAAALASGFARIEPFDVTEAVRAFYRTYATRHGKTRFGDKTPGYAAKLHKVQAVLPEARFIHLIRDGRDVALSMRDVWFGRNKTIGEHIASWRSRINKARACSTRCAFYTEVRYEDLVRRPEAILRRLCEFIDLPFEVEMLAYHEHARARLDEVTTWLNADGSVRVTKAERLFQHRFTSYPVLQTRLGRYRDEMSDDERQRCATIAGDLLADLGYET